MTLSRLWYWATVCIALLATIYFLDFARDNIEGLKSLQWSQGDWVLLLLSALLWFVIVSLGGVVWHTLLRGVGHPLALSRCLTIYLLAQFAKYLPGNVAHHIGRVVMARRAGVPGTITIQTMLVEMAWSASIAAGIALVGVYTLMGEEASGALSVLTLAALLCVSLFLPSAFVWSINHLAPKLLSRLTHGVSLRVPGVRTMVKASLLFLLSFLTVGLLLDVHARFIFDVSESRLLVLTTIFAVVWIAGYITPGAPAGLGVREAMMVSLVSPIYGPAVALGLGLTLRVATTLGDGFAFLTGLVAQRLIHINSLPRPEGAVEDNT